MHQLVARPREDELRGKSAQRWKVDLQAIWKCITIRTHAMETSSSNRRVLETSIRESTDAVDGFLGGLRNL